MNGSSKEREENRALGPDCRTCIRRETCPDATENRFCGQWGSRVPERRLPDPNEQWERGEPAEF